MANYTIDDVNNAVKNGLISQKDASYLIQAMQPGQNSLLGGAAGAGLGALAGGLAGIFGGPAAARMAGRLEESGEPSAAAKAATAAGKEPWDESSYGTLGASIGTPAGAGLGSAAGASLFGSDGPAGDDQATLDAALKTLSDPNAPEDFKQLALQIIQAYTQQQTAGAPSLGGGRGGGGSVWPMIGGALAGGALGALGGRYGASKLAEGATDPNSWVAKAGTGAGLNWTTGGAGALGATAGSLGGMAYSNPFSSGDEDQMQMLPVQ